MNPATSGIGIMNVMLVSVTERTRAIGVLLGVRGSFGLGRALKWPLQVSLEAWPSPPCCLFTVGVFFGYYPAKKAAMLDPIQALRYE